LRSSAVLVQSRAERVGPDADCRGVGLNWPKVRGWDLASRVCYIALEAGQNLFGGYPLYRQWLCENPLELCGVAVEVTGAESSRPASSRSI